jgi:AP-4 complex subunit beta-1
MQLKKLLKRLIDKKHEKKRKDVIKKVIAFMTLGIDVLPLFTEMCLCGHTDDLI